MDSKLEEFLRICYRVFITCNKKTVESRRQVHAVAHLFLSHVCINVLTLCMRSYYFTLLFAIELPVVSYETFKR